jgi:integrase/recombinase XerD
MTAPLITIFVRHNEDCKYKGDEFAKRCDCRKHLRWSANGKQHRRKAGTRSWTEAEQVKRSLEDELAGRAPTPKDQVRYISDAIDVFIQDKRVQSISPSVIGKYTRELDRLRVYCETRGVSTVHGITRELLTGFCATWETLYPSSTTRAKARERLRSFLRYCFEAQWLERIPNVPKFKIDEPETQPLTPAEYARLLDAVYVTIDSKRDGTGLQKKVHAFLQCMRWSGLAIQDASTLKRSNLQFDRAKEIYRITTNRQKTGTHVSVPIPLDVAEELLAVLNDNPVYFFWSGNGSPNSARSNWSQRYIAPIFEAAKIHSDGHMMSHRLRDTFAVDLLEKGVPMEEVSKLLGHTSIRTTEKHYAKWSKGRQDRTDSLVIGTWTKPKKARRLKSGGGVAA